MNTFQEAVKNVQLQRVIGELNALKMCYYNPSDSDNKDFKETSALINGIVQELKNELD